MEEEILCSSLPDNTVSVLQQSQQDSWISTEHHYTNGEQETIVWGKTEVPINQAHGTDLLSLPLKAGPETAEEVEQWDQMLWSVSPLSCTSPRLSFATVQWDMPNPLTETPSLVTDSSFANELCSDGVTNLNTTSPLLYQCEYDSIGRLTPEEREEQNRFDSCLLITNLEWTESGFEPCDAEDVHEPMTQEKEDSTQELVDGNDEIPLKTESEEEERLSVTSDVVQTVDLINTIGEIETSKDEVDSVLGLNPEEEQDDPGVLLTGQEDSEERQTSAKDAEFEEEEDEEEENVANISSAEESKEAITVGCLVKVEVSAEFLQTEDSVLTLNPEELIEPPQSELVEESQCSETEEDTETLEQLHEDPTDRTEEPEMLKDVEHNVDTEQTEEAVDIDEDASKQEEENATRIDDSQEILDLTEKLEEISCSVQQDCDQMASQEREASPQPEHSECELLEMTEEPEQIQAEETQQIEEGQSEDSNQSGEMELTEESTLLENEEQTEEPTESEETVCVEAEETEPTEQSEQPPQPTLSENLDESETTEELSPETEVTQQTAEVETKQVGALDESPPQAEEEAVEVEGDVQTVVVNGEQLKPSETDVPQMNGGEVDRQMACRLAQKLYKLDGVQRVDVVKHLDKDNDFSRAVGEEYLKFFDFTGQTLDYALRSFLKVVVLIGESQERERVLQHFSCRFHQCNPDSFSSSGSVFALTCALMLLNTDLHGQHVGKSMSSSKFVSNLDGMNDGEHFNKDHLKSLYNSIKNEQLEWAVDEEELKSSVLVNEDTVEDAPLRSKSNPFLDVPHDKKASVVKEGFLQRKLHADIDGKRTPWGKRGWKTFYGVLKGMVLYLQKDDYKRDQQVSEEVVSVHHSLALQAADYTKKPNVFRLQTADWRVFLFQASSKVEMNSWISRINLVSALQSSPPFPAAVGSQRKFFRPILPASQSAQTLDRQLQSHTGMLESFRADLLYLQQNPPEGKKTRARDLEEHRVRADYLHHEMCRYEIYIEVLEGWKSVETTGNNVLNSANLNQFDKAVCEEPAGEEEDEEGALKKSHSSPSLELEIAPPTVIKVRRNISERRTYRRTIIPRRNKEA